MPRSMKETRLMADHILERHYRKHQNARKRKAMRDYEKNGWYLCTRGWPDFIATTIFTRTRAVWVPDKLGHFTMEQKRCQGIFRVQGFDVKTVNLEAANFCEP